MVAAHSRLDVRFHLVDRDANGFSMRLSHALVTSDECGQRNALGRRERRIPPRPVAHRLDGLAVGCLVLVRKPLLNQLLSGARMLAF